MTDNTNTDTRTTSLTRAELRTEAEYLADVHPGASLVEIMEAWIAGRSPWAWALYPDELLPEVISGVVIPAVCETCDGATEVGPMGRHDDGTAICSDCGGAGQHICAACRGEAVVYRGGLFGCGMCSSRGAIPCGACSGTGWAPGATGLDHAEAAAAEAAAAREAGDDMNTEPKQEEGPIMEAPQDRISNELIDLIANLRLSPLQMAEVWHHLASDEMWIYLRLSEVMIHAEALDGARLYQADAHPIEEPANR